MVVCPFVLNGMLNSPSADSDMTGSIAATEVRTMFDFLKGKKDEELKADPELALSLSEDGDRLLEDNDAKKAEKQYKKAFDIYTQLNTSEHDKYKSQLAHCASGLGSCYEILEKYSEAYELYLVALDFYKEDISDEKPESIELLADTYCNVGDTFFFRNKYDNSEKEYKEALDLYIKLAGFDSDKYLENIAYCYDCLAKSSSGKEEYSRSIEYYEKVIEIYLKLIADHNGSEFDEISIDYNDELAGVYGDIGYIYSCCKNYDDAEKYYLKAADIFRKLATNDPETFADSLASQYEDLSALYEDMGKQDLAKEYDKKYQNLDI